MSAEQAILGPIVQGIVVVVGWVVVHKLSAARDKDKARREIIAKSADGLMETLNEIFKKSIKYHSEKRDKSLEIEIKIILQDTVMRTVGLSDLRCEKSSLSRCLNEIKAFRKGITGNHFEDEHTEPFADNETQFQDIADAFLKAKRCFLTLKHMQFPT